MKYHEKTLDTLIKILPSTRTSTILISLVLQGYTTPEIISGRNDFGLTGVTSSSLQTQISRIKNGLRLLGEEV